MPSPLASAQARVHRQEHTAKRDQKKKKKSPVTFLICGLKCLHMVVVFPVMTGRDIWLLHDANAMVR